MLRNKLVSFIKRYSQWFMPITVLMVAMMVFLLIFLYHMTGDSRSHAQADIVADALLLERSVDLKQKAGISVLSMLQKAMEWKDAPYTDEEATAVMEKILADSTDAGPGYQAAVFLADGTGLIRTKEESVRLTEPVGWFDRIQALSPGETKTIHVTNDGIWDLDPNYGAVVHVGAFNFADGSKGYVLYFDSSWTEALSVTGKGKSLMTIVDDDWNILIRSSVSDYFVRGTNYWTLVGDEKTNYAMKTYLKTRTSKYNIYNAPNDYTVVVIPMENSTWAACVSVSDHYIGSLSSVYFLNTKKLVIEMIISVLVFFALLILMNTISTIKRNRENKALGEKADQDQLTGLRNKAATERDISEFMRNNTTTQSVLFILDIDNFKTVNDTMGHSFGDDVLHEFGFSLGAMFRASDIAGRIGGDEFMVFVKNLPSDDLVEKESKKIREFIKSFRAGEGVKREITASAGAAIFPRDGVDFDTLYKSADKALYESKRSGKRQLSFFRH